MPNYYQTISTSSPISEKPISSTFVELMKHGHGQIGKHIIMIPLRILMSCKKIHIYIYIYIRKLTRICIYI